MELPVEKFKGIETPFYYYDTGLLKQTIDAAVKSSKQVDNSSIHFAVKSNSNPTVLRIMAAAGLGADCVSGGEIKRCIDNGIAAGKIMFAGVGKTDKEIDFAIKSDILCFNVESEPELRVINQLAAAQGKKVNVALRINPNVDAHTHEYITTGLEENKFGIGIDDMVTAIRETQKLKNVNFYGLHFHIGSQILNFKSFGVLCSRINKLQARLEKLGIHPHSINVGGGLGIDYEHPQKNQIPDFDKYFRTFARRLKLQPDQKFHCELGRAMSAQWGALITRTVFVKRTRTRKFVIVDAGMTELMRPALYHTRHAIINLSNNGKCQTYDVVGPICESSDVFAKDERLSIVHRGDLIAILSAGAYGQVMSSQYNCRPPVKEYCTEDLS